MRTLLQADTTANVAVPDFRTIIDARTIEERGEVMSNKFWRSFKYGRYKVLAQRCKVRTLWEVHIHEGSKHLMTFNVSAFAEICNN